MENILVCTKTAVAQYGVRTSGTDRTLAERPTSHRSRPPRMGKKQLILGETFLKGQRRGKTRMKRFEEGAPGRKHLSKRRNPKYVTRITSIAIGRAGTPGG